MAELGRRDRPSLSADGNGDSVVNQLDYQVWRENFGISIPVIASSSVDAVPKPGRSGTYFQISEACLPAVEWHGVRAARLYSLWSASYVRRAFTFRAVREPCRMLSTAWSLIWSTSVLSDSGSGRSGI